MWKKELFYMADDQELEDFVVSNHITELKLMHEDWNPSIRYIVYKEPEVKDERQD